MDIKEQQKKANRFTAAGVLQMVGGVLVALVFGAVNLVLGALNLIISLGALGGSAWLFLTGLLLGGLLFWRGIYNYKLSSRFRSIAKIVGENAATSFINIERRLGWTRRKLLRSLKQQMKNGFWPNAHIDMGNEEFLLNYDPVFEMPETATGNPVQDELLGGANAMIADIKKAARQIQDEKLKIEAEHLAEIAGQIYRHVAEYPEKAGLVRRLSNYFLPTTVGLLNKYVELQGQSVKTESMTEAMKKIDEVMETLEAVYKNQLDALYNDKMMDVDVEIEVLQNMAGM